MRGTEEGDEKMREALYWFIHAHYTDVLSILPSTLLLVGLLIAVGIDSYIQKWQKQIMLIICAWCSAWLCRMFWTIG